MHQDFKDHLLSITGASDCQAVEIIQSLWSGYGNISRYQLTGSALDTIVIKQIALSAARAHPRGWNTDHSHHRKVRSYAVETYWYEHWNGHCGNDCRTAKFLGSYSMGKDQWIILEDLDSDFPIRKQELNLSEVKTCLRWLANFHATFLDQEPIGLWEVGTYWHLDTRPDEFELIEHQGLKSKAHRIDELLNQCTYRTIVHGDAKLGNFCFSDTDSSVAAVDFQYVGGGCGMKDVAYFIGSCMDSSACEIYQEELLDEYFAELGSIIGTASPQIDFEALEKEWRSMYPIAWTDFTRFLLGWMPSHQKVNDYALRMMDLALEGL